MYDTSNNSVRDQLLLGKQKNVVLEKMKGASVDLKEKERLGLRTKKWQF